MDGKINYPTNSSDKDSKYAEITNGRDKGPRANRIYCLKVYFWDVKRY